MDNAPTTTKHALPQWAPKVSRSLIRQFYISVGQGFFDEDVIEELGIALFARADSMIQVREAKLGHYICPACGHENRQERPSPRNLEMKCASCTWKTTWLAYRETFYKQNLSPGRMEAYLRQYVKEYAVARTLGEKVVLIDTLIHRFHGELQGGYTPCAFQLIAGSLTDLGTFLDALTYGDNIPGSVRANRERWRKRIRTGTPFWASQLKSSCDALRSPE